MSRSSEIVHPSNAPDPFETYANAIAPRSIVGELMKFSKGDFIVGENQIVQPGTKFTVNCDELLAGWIKWQNSKPVEQRMVRVADGVRPALRSELGDTDENDWETDNKGEPKDPWQFTNYLPLMSEGGNLFTFTTSSRGGLNAIGDLVRRYANHRKRNPDVHCVVSLEVGSYQHQNRSYGIIKFPDFVPAGYENKAKFTSALNATDHVPDTDRSPDEVRAISDSAKSVKADDDMDDEIPF